MRLTLYLVVHHQPQLRRQIEKPEAGGAILWMDIIVGVHVRD